MNSYLTVGNNQCLALKYCSTCFIHRPPRTVHCRLCDNCVEVLDHHCVWLDNCIGKRNYPHFFSFLLSLSLFCLLTLLRHALLPLSPLSLVLALLAALFALFALYMLAYHSYLIATNSTTNEDIKNVHSPFNLMRHLRHRWPVERLWQAGKQSLLWPRAPIAMPPLDSQVGSSVLLTPQPAQEQELLPSQLLRLLRMSQSQSEVKTIRSRLAGLKVAPSAQEGLDDAPQVCTPMQSSRVEYKQKRERQMAMWQQSPPAGEPQSEVFPCLPLQKVVMIRSDNHTGAKTASRERKDSGTDLFDMLDQLDPQRLGLEQEDHLDRYHIATSNSQLAHSSVLLTRQDPKRQKTPYILEEEAEVASIASPPLSHLSPP